MKRFRWPARALLVATSSGLIGLALNLVAMAYTTPSQRLIPELSNAGSYLAVVPAAVLLYLLVGLVRGGRATSGERREKAKHWALYALATVVSLAAALALVATHPSFPLGPFLVDRESSPDGSKTGYVYRSCFLSTHVGVFVRAEGEVMLQRVESLSRPNCEETLRVYWVGNGQPEVVDGFGRRLTDVQPPQMQLDLGPQ